MAHGKEQKRIHINPAFFTSRGQTKPKVHVNPAFLQKSQADESEEDFLKSINTQMVHNEGGRVQKHLENFLHMNSVGTSGQHHFGLENNNSPQSPKVHNSVVRGNEVHLSFQRNHPNLEYALSNTKSYAGTPPVSSANYQNYHNTDIHFQTGGVRPTQYSSPHSKKGGKSSVYSWMAVGTKVPTSTQRVGLPDQFTNKKLQTAVISGSSSTHKFQCIDIPNRNSEVRSPIQLVASKLSSTEQSKLKMNSGKNYVHSPKHKKNNMCPVNKKHTLPKTKETIRLNELDMTGASSMDRSKNQKTSDVKSPEAVHAESKAHSEGEGRENSAVFVETAAQNSKNSNILINPKLLRYLAPNGSQDKISVLPNKLHYNRPHSCMMSNAHKTLSSSIHSRNDATKAVADASKRSGKYKVISKTKLVRQRSASSFSQAASHSIQPRNSITKVTHEACKRSGKYKVVSKTKLVRWRSGSLSGQTSSLSVRPKTSGVKVTPEAPKKNIRYRVISKTKLVRRRSDSSSRETTAQVVSKTKPSETTSVILPQGSFRVKSLSRPQKFPARTRRYSIGTKTNLKRRYTVMSPTKLIRSLSNTSSSSGDGMSGKPKYFVKTKTKLIRQRSHSGIRDSKSSTCVEGAKTNLVKSDEDRKKKFSVLSKTKLVRRRSDSGMNETKVMKTPTVFGLANRGVRTVIKRHKLVRNASAKSGKYWTSKKLDDSCARNVNTLYKIVNSGVKLSSKQKAARGIISKYKINRLKLESSETLRKNNLRNYTSLSKLEKKCKFSYITRKGDSVKRSDRIISIGGILYKSTKTSLRKQLSKAMQENTSEFSGTECIVWLRGDQFHLSAGGRTLKRVKDGSTSLSAKHSLSRVHIGGLTYSRTKAGQYELTQIHQARAVLSSAKQRSVMTLSQRRKKGILQKRNEHCIFYNRFGRCTKKDRGECPYIHDPQRVAICTRFLRGRCPVSNCPFSHTVDPDKMPVCSHFVRATCTRDGCPYRHVRVNPSAPICLDFLKGHCLAGEECKKQHVLVCEEFNRTGKCPRGASCPLSHHRGRGRFRKSVSLEPPDGENKKQLSSQYKKRKKSENEDVLGKAREGKRAEKKFKEDIVRIVKQRYFQIPTQENEREDPEKLSKFNQDFAVEAKTKKLESESLDKRKDDSTPVTSSQSLAACASSQQGKQMTHIQDSSGKVQNDLIPDNFANTSYLEETRLRILQKLDKMKCLYNTHENNTDLQMDTEHFETNTDGKDRCIAFGETDQLSTVDNTEEIHEISIDKKVQISERSKIEFGNNETDSSNNEMHRFHRPPLPQKLPSYIPLNLDEDL